MSIDSVFMLILLLVAASGLLGIAALVEEIWKRIHR